MNAISSQMSIETGAVAADYAESQRDGASGPSSTGWRLFLSFIGGITSAWIGMIVSHALGQSPGAYTAAAATMLSTLVFVLAVTASSLKGHDQLTDGWRWAVFATGIGVATGAMLLLRTVPW